MHRSAEMSPQAPDTTQNMIGHCREAFQMPTAAHALDRAGSSFWSESAPRTTPRSKKTVLQKHDTSGRFWGNRPFRLSHQTKQQPSSLRLLLSSQERPLLSSVILTTTSNAELSVLLPEPNAPSSVLESRVCYAPEFAHPSNNRSRRQQLLKDPGRRNASQRRIDCRSNPHPEEQRDPRKDEVHNSSGRHRLGLAVPRGATRRRQRRPPTRTPAACIKETWQCPPPPRPGKHLDARETRQMLSAYPPRSRSRTGGAEQWLRWQGDGAVATQHEICVSGVDGE